MEMIVRAQILVFAMAAIGMVGAMGILITNLSYKRILKNKNEFIKEKDKWLRLMEQKDKMIHRMNGYVWYPSLGVAFCMGLLLSFERAAQVKGEWNSMYPWILSGILTGLLLLRTGLDISSREGEAYEWMKEYMDRANIMPIRAKRERELPHVIKKPEKDESVQEKKGPAKEAVVDNIVESIRQSAAAEGHFHKMLTPEETAIVREIIQEFMNG